MVMPLAQAQPADKPFPQPLPMSTWAQGCVFFDGMVFPKQILYRLTMQHVKHAVAPSQFQGQL